MKAQQDKYSHIKGWGIDADPDNDPASPMRSNPTEQHKGMTWIRPTLQKETVEVLHSIERPYLTAVYGTTCPPRGLSGWIRRMAFKSSENMYRHWLPLVLADRIDVIESMIMDFFHLHFPNYIKEKGWPALWKHNKAMFLKRVGPPMAIVSLVIAQLIRKRVAQAA